MQRAEKILYLACAIFIAGILIAYVGAIPNGYWQDEYYNFARIRTDGFAFTLERLLTWSPRPLSEIRSSAYWLTILAFAFAVTAFLTIPASLYQFGALCCERHDTLRQCLILLSLIAAACAFGIKRGPAKTESRARCITYIGLSVAVSSVTSIGALVHDYSRYGQFHTTYAEDWSRARSSGPTMLFKVPAPGKIVGAPPVKDGIYSPTTPAIRGNLWWIGGTFDFFHKEKLIIETAGAK